MICASDTKCRFIEVPRRAFSEYDEKKATKEKTVRMKDPEPVGFRPEVKILTIAEIENGHPCLVIELTCGPNCGQINFI